MARVTVHDLITALPGPVPLLERCRAFAVLDAVFEPRYRTHTFVRSWRKGVSLARMENGGGDEYTIVFDPAGVFLSGFDHECEVTPWREEPRAHWPGLLDGLPAPLAGYPADPAFQLEDFFDATVCAWHETGAAGWRCGPVAFPEEESDGADQLFGTLADGSAEAYAEWAEDYFACAVDRPAVTSVLAGTPLTRRVVTTLNPSADFGAIAAEATTMGFPVQPGTTPA